MADPRLDPANDDDPFDDRLRRELANLVPDPEPAAEVFNRLTPAFRRARRVQQVKHGTLAVTALALVLGGIGMASLMLGDEARLTVAGESELSRDVVRSDSGERLAVAGTTTTIEQADSRSESDSEGAPSESDSDDPDSDNSDSDSHDSDDQSSTSGNAADARRRGDATDDSKDRPSTDD
ncbi:MAG: hypothetical protein OER95_15725, partial [Acidimicrobiia bacterium]|nr:hypothetical protein [Acidimicrobiia bacterium]